MQRLHILACEISQRVRILRRMNAHSFKEIIRKPITTLAEAVAFFEVLQRDGKTFNPDDCASDIVNIETNKPLFTPEEANLVEDRMTEAWELNWPKFVGDPHGVVLGLDTEYRDGLSDEPQLHADFRGFDAWRESGCPSLPTDMRATVAQIDGVGDKFDCFTQGKFWNGWLDVFMTPAQLAKFMDGDAIEEYRKATDDPLDLTPDAETGLISMNGFCFVEAEGMEVAP